MLDGAVYTTKSAGCPNPYFAHNIYTKIAPAVQLSGFTPTRPIKLDTSIHVHVHVHVYMHIACAYVHVYVELHVYQRSSVCTCTKWIQWRDARLRCRGENEQINL